MSGITAQVEAAMTTAKLQIQALIQRVNHDCAADVEKMLNDITKGMQDTFTLLFGSSDFFQGKPGWNSNVSNLLSRVEHTLTSSATS